MLRFRSILFLLTTFLYVSDSVLTVLLLPRMATASPKLSKVSDSSPPERRRSCPSITAPVLLLRLGRRLRESGDRDRGLFTSVLSGA